jgi:hypothetical protein
MQAGCKLLKLPELLDNFKLLQTRFCMQGIVCKFALSTFRTCTSPTFYLEEAKLLWKQGLHHQALLQLQTEWKKKSSALFSPRNSSSENSFSVMASDEGNAPEIEENDLLAAKAMLLIGRWMQETGQVQHDDIVSQYKRVTKVQPRYFQSVPA